MTTADVKDAVDALRDLVRRTPVLSADALDEAGGGPVVAKDEGLQLTGSFKVRGALNRVRTLSDAARANGIIAVSAGNAAQGFAYAARTYGCRATVVMPENAVPEKVAATVALGARVIQEGVTNSTEAFERAHELQAREELTFVHPYDDPMVIAGAATATVELLEDAPHLARLLVPCSGGGLLAGAILAVQACAPSVEVVGVQPTKADAFARSLAAGQPLRATSTATIADGLTAPIPGELTFAIVRAAGVRVVLVGDDDILAATRVLVRSLRVVVEPSAAVGLAALMAHDDLRSGQPTGLLLSGSNVSWSLLGRLLQDE